MTCTPEELATARDEADALIAAHWAYGDRWRSQAQAWVGIGWAPIVRDCIAAIVEVAPSVAISQVKEKLGGLRIYISVGDGGDAAAVRALIEGAERAAAETCETCSAPGRFRDIDGLYVVACDDCAAQVAEERRGTR